MKALAFKVPESQSSSFQVQVDHLAHFYDQFHHHPELQITWIIKGRGTLFTGDHISNFQEGEVLALGPNMPHLLRNDALYYEADSPGVEAISIFLDQRILDNALLQLPEWQGVSNWIRHAERGYRIINPSERSRIQQKMQQLLSAQGVSRFLLLLEILHEFSIAELSYLSQVPFPVDTNPVESKRLNAVFQFIMAEYARPIKIEEVASVANLSVSAFCRYFKLRTQKTCTQFINELRVAMACQLLLQTDQSISEVAYQVGFPNLSNFNRQFRKIVGRNPKAFLAQGA